MRILHLHTKINLTCGISKTIYLIAKNLVEDFEHVVFTLGGDAIPKFKTAGINIISSKCKSNNIFQTILIFAEIIKIVKKQRIDIIHSHHRYFDLLAYFISQHISVRTVTSVQSKVFGKKTLSYKADILLACSNSIKEHLANYFIIDPSKIRVIYNFVDIAEAEIGIQKSILKKNLNINENSVVIGFVGRFSLQEKGIDVLLEAFRKVSQVNVDLILLLIGEGEDRDYIYNFIAGHKVQAVIVAPNKNIFEMYNIMDLVVLPSRIDPFPLVMLECGLMKKAFIGSNVDGIKELVENRIDGILVNVNDTESLAKELEFLITNTELRKELGNKLLEKVVKNFSKDQIIPLYAKTYREIFNYV